VDFSKNKIFYKIRKIGSNPAGFPKSLLKAEFYSVKHSYAEFG
jgi:hypothetical protein